MPYQVARVSQKLSEQEKQDNDAAVHLLMDEVHEQKRKDEEQFDREYAMRLQQEEDENERDAQLAQREQEHKNYRTHKNEHAGGDMHDRQRRHGHHPRDEVVNAIKGVGRFLKKKSPRGNKELDHHPH